MSEGQIYVRGYAKKVGEQDLKKIFTSVGTVSEVKMFRDYSFVVNI